MRSPRSCARYAARLSRRTVRTSGVVYSAVIEPLCSALNSAPPELLASQRMNNEVIYAIAVGDKVFGISVYKGPKVEEVKLYPATARRSVNMELLREERQPSSYGNNQAFGRNNQSWGKPKGGFDRFLSGINAGDRRSDVVTIEDSDGKLRMVSHSIGINAPKLAGRLIELASLLVRNARAPVRVEEKRGGGLFDAVVSAVGLGNKTADLSTGMALRKLAEGGLQGAAGVGIPGGLADDLSAVTVWRDRALALTTQKSAEGSTRLWIEDELNGRSFFREIPTPADLPAHGVSMVVAGDNLHLIGGMDDDGTVHKESWVYPLQSGKIYGFGQHAWQKGAPLDSAAAWTVPAVVGNEVYLVDGVSKFAASEKGEAGNDPRLVAFARRGMFKLSTMTWARKSEAPESLIGAYAATDKRCIVLGPGNALDGQMYICDTAYDGAWYALPSLPKEVGLGQVVVSDDSVFYMGGFNADGTASKAIYSLNLNGLSGRWENLGESPFVAGRSRIVRRSGKLSAFQVTPNGSAMYHLGS